MRQANLGELRVLLVARKGASTQVLRTVFAIAGITNFSMASDPRRAIELLCSAYFDAVFVEGALEYDGMPFALAARRAPSLLNRMIALFAVYPAAQRRDVEKARDLGVHDVICRPVSPRTIANKLRAALSTPRPFIVAPGFFGPDRRSRERAGQQPFKERRTRSARKAKLPVAQIQD